MVKSAAAPIASHARRRLRGFGAGLLLAAFAASANDSDSIKTAIARIDAGQFQAAETGITEALSQNNIGATTRHELEFQRERMRRILLDFTLDEETAKARVRQQIPDLGDAEFADWDARGLLEHRVIDGRRLYFQRAPSNLFVLSAEARARRAAPKTPVQGPMETANAHHREVVVAALRNGKASVLPRRVRFTQSLAVNADAVPAGETIRAWIPYPRAIPGRQDDIRFVSSTPSKHAIAPESTLQRTVYLEKTAVAGRPTEFSVTYDVTISAYYQPVDPSRVAKTQITPELAEFIAERAPHIVFTEAMKLFSRQIVGDETDPWRITQKLYTAIDQVPWAGALEYSTITNIGDYALHAGHADCGQQTLLLITLLRLNGIPARWQSGMVFSDGSYNNLHDWAQVYIAPYGWLPMDVTTGRLDSDDPAIADFYLGGFDAYRIAFNDDYGRELVPTKTHFRSETVDLQRGEAEWRGGNLYFDQWEYNFRWQFLPVARGRGTSRTLPRS